GSLRQAARDTKPHGRDENRVAKKTTKSKKNSTHGVLSSITDTAINVKKTSSASASSGLTPGAKKTSGQKVYSSILQLKQSVTELKDTMAALAAPKPRPALANIDNGRNQVYRDPTPHVSRPRRALSSATDKPVTEILATRSILNKSINTTASTAAPQKISRSVSSSNILPPKQPNPRILAHKPSAPALTTRAEASVLTGLKRRAASADHESGRVVRAKVAKETTHIARTNSASDSLSSGETSAASQETFVESLPAGPIESDAESQFTVVDQGIPPNVIKRKFARPGPSFSSHRSINLPSPFEKDFDADEQPAAEDKSKCDWDDIDAEDANDPLMVSEYINDIIEYMRESEGKFIPDHAYMNKQIELNWEMRRVLIDWVAKIHAQFRMMPETLFLAVNLIDRYLSKRQVSTTMLQLVGVTGLLIACKYEETTCPPFEDLVFLSGMTYTVEEIKNAEMFMLRILDFDLSAPSPLTFLRRVSKAENYNIQTRTIGKYVMEVCMMDHRLIHHPPSLIAAAGICLARRMLDAGPWDGNLRHYSGYTEAELQPCINVVLDHMRKAPDDEFIYLKYKARRYFRCSLFCEEWAIKNAYRLDLASPPIGDFPEFADTPKPASSKRAASNLNEIF
ncbi:G2/mitotic-specific cyclin, partial [Coemansia erecta]